MPWVVSTANTIWYQADTSLKSWVVTSTKLLPPPNLIALSLYSKDVFATLVLPATPALRNACLAVATLLSLVQKLIVKVFWFPALLCVTSKESLLAELNLNELATL